MSKTLCQSVSGTVAAKFGCRCAATGHDQFSALINIVYRINGKTALRQTFAANSDLLYFLSGYHIGFLLCQFPAQYIPDRCGLFRHRVYITISRFCIKPHGFKKSQCITGIKILQYMKRKHLLPGSVNTGGNTAPSNGLIGQITLAIARCQNLLAGFIHSFNN